MVIVEQICGGGLDMGPSGGYGCKKTFNVYVRRG